MKSATSQKKRARREGQGHILPGVTRIKDEQDCSLVAVSGVGEHVRVGATRVVILHRAIH